MLPLAAAGRVSPLEDGDAAIVWADALTVPVARAFLATGAKVLITRTGNAVCHGANLLRVARIQGREVGWISGLTITGTGVGVVTAQGSLSVSDGDVLVIARGYEPSRAIFEFRTSRRTAVCLWPHRFYSEPEFTMHQAGLELSAFDLCDQVIPVTRDSRGRIWFESGELDEGMVRARALDEAYSLGSLREMSAAYDQLILDISSTQSSELHSDLLQDLANRFFRRLLLFHSCYADVLDTAASSLESVIPPERALEIASTNLVSHWLYELADFADSSKQGTQPTWWGVLPPMSVAQAVEDTIMRLLSSAQGGQTTSGIATRIEWLATMAVVKEIKMVLAKNLFAGLAVLTRSSG